MRQGRLAEAREHIESVLHVNTRIIPMPGNIHFDPRQNSLLNLLSKYK